MKHNNLWILVGVPGSGKSYWAKNHCGNAAYISRDELRFALLKRDEEYFKHEKMVYSKFIHEIQYHLNKGEDVIADATHLNWASRRKLIQHLNLEGVNVNCVVFKTPLAVCLKRNAGREGLAKVPENVIVRMNSTYTHPYDDPYKYHMMKNVYEDGSECIVGNK